MPWCTSEAILLITTIGKIWELMDGITKIVYHILKRLKLIIMVEMITEAKMDHYTSPGALPVACSTMCLWRLVSKLVMPILPMLMVTAKKVLVHLK